MREASQVKPKGSNQPIHGSALTTRVLATYGVHGKDRAMPADDPAPPPPPNGKHRAADARKAALIHHADEQMVAHGIQHASLNEILRLAGGSKATVVKYFGGKAGLFAAAMARAAQGVIAELALDTEGKDDLKPALASLLSGVAFYLRPDALPLLGLDGEIQTGASLAEAA
jgi:AcrR family transcriptional regulator